MGRGKGGRDVVTKFPPLSTIFRADNRVRTETGLDYLGTLYLEEGFSLSTLSSFLIFSQSQSRPLLFSDQGCDSQGSLGLKGVGTFVTKQPHVVQG
jgi:hypothetical protein